MNNSQRYHTRLLFKGWLIAVGIMLLGYLLDLFNPQSSFIAPGLEQMTAGEAFFFAVKRSVIELGVLYLILRPWTFTTRTRYRALLAFILFLPYFGYLLILGDGGAYSNAAHLFWMAMVLVALGLGTLKPGEAAVGPPLDAVVEHEPKRLL